MFNKLASEHKWILTRGRGRRQWHNWVDHWVAVNASQHGLTTRPVAAAQNPSFATLCPGDLRMPASIGNSRHGFSKFKTSWQLRLRDTVTIVSDSTDQINPSISSNCNWSICIMPPIGRLRAHHEISSFVCWYEHLQRGQCILACYVCRW